MSSIRFPIFSSFKKHLFLGLTLFQTVSLLAQDDTRIGLANLAQDVGLLTREVRALRLEVESMRSESKTLKNRLAGVDSLRAQLTVINDNVLTQVAALEKAIAAGDAATRKDVLSEVAKQIKAFGAQTDKTLQAISEAVNQQPSVSSAERPNTFDKNYPKDGIVYEVQPGDTLSRIAQKLESRVSWIQNANLIADPTKLQAGQSLFVPQGD